MLLEPELQELANSIKANGLRQPIWLYEGKILDGRNRYVACKIAGVEPATCEFKGGSIAEFIADQNIRRRHLTQSQKATGAVELIPWFEKEAKERMRLSEGRGKKGSAKVRDLKSATGKSAAKAAKATGVGTRYVEQAKALKEAAPEEFEKVKSGEKTLTQARRVLKRREHAKKVERAKAAPTPKVAGPFNLVLADPPWRYEHCEADNREIENHYGTATLEEIFKHSPKTTDDAILFMWATAPKLEEAFKVMAAWGFSYRSCAIWDKEKIGMGYWWRIQHELLLVGIKGSPGCTPECERIGSIFREPRGKHSAKPACVYEWIERAFPELGKLEMYCRTPRKGWHAWGNEV